MAAALWPVAAPATANASPLPAAAARGEAQARFAALDERSRLRILIRLIRRGRHQLAARLFALKRFTGRFGANRNLFIEGLLAKAGKDYAAAAAKFRAALAADPNLTLVRMELAHTLYLANEDDGARHHLKLLKASAPTTDTARQFDRFIDAIDARRPWRFDIYASMAPSTNFNNGTTQQVIMVNGLPLAINSNARKKSGIGWRGGANGGYRVQLSRGVSAILAAGVNATDYDGDVYDDIIVSQSLDVEKRIGAGSLSVGVHGSERWSGQSEFITTYGPQATATLALGPRSALRVRLRHTLFDYRISDYRNGAITSIENRLSHGFSPGAVGTLISGVERGRTKRDYLDYWAAFVGAAAYYEGPAGITFAGEVVVRRQVHDGLYPLLDLYRHDTRLAVSASLTKRDLSLFGLAPQIIYSYTRNWSNSPFDDYESHGANLTVTRKF